MKTIALLALLAVGCGGEAFTSTDPGKTIDRLPVDSATMTDAGVTSANDSETIPTTVDSGVTLRDDAAPDVAPEQDATPHADAKLEEDASPEASDAAPDAPAMCSVDVCAHSCIPVEQVGCCKANGMCGCMTVIGTAGGCT